MLSASLVSTAITSSRGRLHDLLPQVVNDHGTLLTVLLLSVLVLGIWRLFRFTAIHIFYPNDPKELPYWVPRKFLALLD